MTDYKNELEDILDDFRDWVHESDCGWSGRTGQKTPDEAVAAIEALLSQHSTEVSKAYGGCANCYGKGYSTVRQGRSYRKNGVYATHEINEEMIYCTCDRGKQLEKLLSQHSKKRELEAVVTELEDIDRRSFANQALLENYIKTKLEVFRDR